MSAHPAPSGHAMIPRGALLAMAALALFALGAAGLVRLSGVEIREPDAAPVAVRMLRFEDAPDGTVAVLDARDGTPIRSFAGEQGFLRGVLRGLARERRARGVGAEPPFELIGRADGRLTLHDPATGRMVDLESFGPTNAGVFARLLDAAPQRP